MAEDREMTDEYAALSYMAGWFAAAVYKFSGSSYFITKIRAESWDLTWEKLIQWQQEAIESGVPADELKVPDRILEMMPSLLPVLMKAQEIRDAQQKAKDET